MTTPEHRGQNPNELPLWFRIAAIGIMIVLLVVHVIIDIFVGDYEGSGTSLMIGGIVGTALGFNEFFRRGGSGS